ncbi:MAG TPA: FAD binding domain-containing protein [Beijerinckiaceae bacterium]|nr:FAD binding domain-containing protein [Beijerinckiaceae bacterium]
MKPCPFDYVRPHSLDEACSILDGDEDAQIIAGGQTLVPMLAMRLARPSRLVDVMRILELDRLVEEGQAICVGAATRQVVIERSALVAAKLPLLAQAIAWVGHPPTRSRGTVGGSIANADPSAEIPLVATALEAELVVRTKANESRMNPGDFFLGPMMTAIEAGGVLKEIRFPVWSGRVGASFQEVSARRGDFAFVAAAAQVRLNEAGVCEAATIALGGVADHPTRLRAASAALIGGRLTEREIDEALADEIGAIEALADHHVSAEYRRRVARLLARRALCEARERARRGP